MGRWLIPSDAPYGQDRSRSSSSVTNFAALLPRRPNVVRRTISLFANPTRSRRNAAPLQMARSADLSPSKAHANPNIYQGASIKLAPRHHRRAGNAELQPLFRAVRQTIARPLSRQLPVNLSSIIDVYAVPSAPRCTCSWALWARCCYWLRQRIDLTASSVARSASMSLPSRRHRRRSHSHDSPAADRIAGIALVARPWVFAAWKSLPLIVAWMPRAFPSKR